MDTFPLLDRILALAPLAVLAYVLRRNESERSRLLRALESDRESFRNERRELINRVQFPTRMPVATAPIEPMRPGDRRPRIPDARRQQWQKVGTAAPAEFALPTDRDDAPGAEE